MALADLSNPNRQPRMIQISAPNGAAGCWIVDVLSTNIEAAINSLKNIINTDNTQRFSISCSKLEDVLLPDTDDLCIIDDELRYISPEFIVIAPVSEDRCIRNVDLMSRVVRQCILSPKYYDYVIKMLEDRCVALGNGELNVRNHEPDKYMLWSAYKKTIASIHSAVSAITGNPVQTTSV